MAVFVMCRRPVVVTAVILFVFAQLLLIVFAPLLLSLPRLVLSVAIEVKSLNLLYFLRLGTAIKIPVNVANHGFFFFYLGNFLRYAKKVSLLRLWLFLLSSSILIIRPSIIIII